MADNPMDKVNALMKRLKGEADKLGLDLEHVALIPNMGDGPVMMQAVFLLRPESITEPAPEKTPEELEFDRQFADIEQGFKMDERKDEQQDIRDNIAGWLDGN